MNLIQQERIQFSHKGVNIYIDLDYNNGTVSFVNKEGDNKNFTFRKRTRNYLGGWWIILDALQRATEFADLKLKEQEELRKDIKNEELINLMIGISELK